MIKMKNIFPSLIMSSIGNAALPLVALSQSGQEQEKSQLIIATFAYALLIGFSRAVFIEPLFIIKRSSIYKESLLVKIIVILALLTPALAFISFLAPPIYQSFLIAVPFFLIYDSLRYIEIFKSNWKTLFNADLLVSGVFILVTVISLIFTQPTVLTIFIFWCSVFSIGILYLSLKTLPNKFVKSDFKELILVSRFTLMDWFLLFGGFLGLTIFTVSKSDLSSSASFRICATVFGVLPLIAYSFSVDLMAKIHRESEFNFSLLWENSRKILLLFMCIGLLAYSIPTHIYNQIFAENLFNLKGILISHFSVLFLNLCVLPLRTWFRLSNLLKINWIINSTGFLTALIVFFYFFSKFGIFTLFLAQNVASLFSIFAFLLFLFRDKTS